MTLTRTFYRLSYASALLSISMATQAITNAEDSEADAHPFIAHISLSASSDISCSGVIIDESSIVMSALCLYTAKASHITVNTGTHKLHEVEQFEDSYEVAQIIRHPEFDVNTFANDIALLKLATPIEMNARTQPISLSSTTPKVGASATIYGWGAQSGERSAYSNPLQESVQRTTDMHACETVYKGALSLKNKFCVADSQQKPCVGDDGAALVSQGKLAGLFSYDQGIRCSAGSPSVYTDISAYKAWIEGNL